MTAEGTPPAEPECEHTEHDVRGNSIVGRRFDDINDRDGTWECSFESVSLLGWLDDAAERRRA